MGARLLRDENGHLGTDLIRFHHPVRRGVGADGKLAQRQGIVVEEHVVLDIFPVFLFFFKIAARIVGDPAIGKMQLQIFIIQFV